MDKLTDTRVKRMSDIIEDYLNCLNSIGDTLLGNFALLMRAELMAVSVIGLIPSLQEICCKGFCGFWGVSSKYDNKHK